MKTMIVLKGSAVTLRPLSQAHASEKYGAWFGDKLVCRDNRHGGHPHSIAELKRYISSSHKSKDRVVFAIHLNKTGQHIGNISLNGIDRKKRSAEISILIGERSAWGKGAGFEACALVRLFAFGKMSLDRVWMGMTARNTAMIRVAQKLGLKMDRVIKGGFVKDGRRYDLVEYSLGRLHVPKRPRIVLMMKYGNLMGLEYIRAFKKNGIRISAVVFQGDSFDPRDREIVMERTAGAYRPLFTGEILNDWNVPMYFVEKHSSRECERILRSLKPDMLLLGGAGIIPVSILQLAPLGVLNCHPGLLPDYRGCSCVEWAIYNQDIVAATCHTVTGKIDWGAVVHSEPLPYKYKETYPHLRARMIGHQVKVMTAGIKKYLKGGVWPLMGSEGRYWKTMDAKKLSIVKSRLEKGGYKPVDRNVI